MSDVVEQRRPADAVWLSLIEAVTWVHCEHSVGLAEMLAGAFKPLGLSETELRRELEPIWQGLADQATSGSLRIRGKRDGEKKETELSVDDLRNCRHLVWTKLGQTARQGWLREIDDPTRMVVRVERHPDTAEGAWERQVGESPGDDYYDVVVLREDLMRLFPPSTNSVRRMKSAVGAKDAAKRFLAGFCDANPPKTKTRDELIAELKQLFELPHRTAMNVWTEVTETRPQWRAPGRRPKTISPKSRT